MHTASGVDTRHQPLACRFLVSGRPIDRWTHRELADEVIARGIVTSISISQVGRYLAQAELQPHRSKYWLTTKEKDPEVFEQQVQTVCQTYLEAPDLYFQENTYTVSVDEMPGIQALERIAKTIPMQSGQVERIELLKRSNAPPHGRKAGQADERIVKLWLSWANNCELRH